MSLGFHSGGRKELIRALKEQEKKHLSRLTEELDNEIDENKKKLIRKKMRMIKIHTKQVIRDSKRFLFGQV